MLHQTARPKSLLAHAPSPAASASACMQIRQPGALHHAGPSSLPPWSQGAEPASRACGAAWLLLTVPVVCTMCTMMAQ